MRRFRRRVLLATGLTSTEYEALPPARRRAIREAVEDMATDLYETSRLCPSMWSMIRGMYGFVWRKNPNERY